MNKGLLTEGESIFIKTIHIYEIGPNILILSSINLPPRRFPLLNAQVELNETYLI